MEKKVLKPKKTRNFNFKLSRFFEDKKKRYFFMLLFMLPFLIAIAIFGNIAYREVKSIMALAGGGQTEIKDENKIESMGFIQRDNATDLQKEYFAELKKAIEEDEVFDDLKVAEYIARSYVADFYTWTNKQGQYDVGGLCYVYDGEFVNGDHYKENVLLKARDGFYKYIGNYMTDYGIENLLEVIDVEVTKCEKSAVQYGINEHYSYEQDANGEWYDRRENNYYDTYLVSLRWTYNPETPLTLSNFANSINLAIINHDGKFYIVEASNSPIEIKKVENETGSQEDNQETQENSDSDNN